METIYFLCGNFNKKFFVYAIKNDQSDWHYFAEVDSFVDVHVSLPIDLTDKISQLKANTLKPIPLTLTAEQLCNYVNEGKFVFKGKELNTCIQLSGVTADRRSQPNKPNQIERVQSKSTHDIVFEVGKTNPAIFLRDFEKCSDVKTEKEKLYKLRNFVDENDRPQFSMLFFKDDWVTARALFLKIYSLQFTKNMVKELSFGFEEETSLRSFVARKMNAMSTYTSLPLKNQLEMILSQLPTQIANVFIAEDKLNQTKTEILEFCELFQEYCDYTENNDTETTSLPTSPDVTRRNDVQDLEIFDFQEGIESDTSSTSTNSSGSGNARKRRRSGRSINIPRTIAEELGSSTGSESNQTDEY